MSITKAVQISALFLIALATFVAASYLNADSIDIQNAGFEEHVLNDGEFSFSIPGWDRLGPGGTFNPTTTQFAVEAPEGMNILVIGGTGAIIEQTLGEVLEYGTYLLTAEFGQRLDVPFAEHGMSLLAGGAILIDDFQDLPTPDSGEFLTGTRRYTVKPGSANEIALGSPLKIRFFVLTNSSQETSIDDVRLNFSAAVPEPCHGAVSMALFFLVIFDRKRRK